MNENSNNSLFKEIKKKNKIKRVLYIFFFILGGIIINISSFFYQKYAEESTFINISNQALNEIKYLYNDAEDASFCQKEEYNSINQNNNVSLAISCSVNGLLYDYYSKETPEEKEKIKIEIDNFLLDYVIKQNDANKVHVVDMKGTILFSSSSSYLDTNIIDLYGESSFPYLIKYEEDEKGNPLFNGTVEFLSLNEYISHPFYFSNKDDEELSSYLFSFSIFAKDDIRLFFVNDYGSFALDEQIKSILSLNKYLDNSSVYDTGRVLCLDNNTKTFAYFNLDGKSYQGLNYIDLGLKHGDDPSFQGFENMNGINFYVVNSSYVSELFNYTFVTFIKTNELYEPIKSYLISMSFLYFAFAIVILFYCSALKKDKIMFFLNEREKTRLELEKDKEKGLNDLTNEDIDEKAQNKMMEIFKDKKNFFNRKLIFKNKEYYFSSQTFFKVLPLSLFGLIISFLICFTAQTIISLESATSTSSEKISDADKEICNRINNASDLIEYEENLLVNKLQSSSYLVNNTPELYIDLTDKDNVHDQYVVDEKGVKTYLKDQYNRVRKAYSNSYGLISFNNNFHADYVHLYDEEGFCFASDNDKWHNELSFSKDSVDYNIRKVIYGDCSLYMENILLDDFSLETKYKIAHYFYYYTYDGKELSEPVDKTFFISERIFNKQEKGEVTGYPTISKHRGAVVFQISDAVLWEIIMQLSFSNILSNISIYGENSFIMAFDTSNDRKVIYSPDETMIGKKYSEIGLNDYLFLNTSLIANSVYQNLSGKEMYMTSKLFDEYYLVAVIPQNVLFPFRVSATFLYVCVTFLILCLFMFFGSLASQKVDVNLLCLLGKRNNKKDDTNKVSGSLNSSSNRFFSSKHFTNIYQNWKFKKAEERTKTIIFLIFLALSIAITIAFLLARFSNQNDSVFAYICLGKWSRGFNLFALVASSLLIIVSVTYARLFCFIVTSISASFNQKTQTTARLVTALVMAAAIIGSLFASLYFLGLNVASLLASAGIISVVIGIGAQAVIGDILAGIFIVFEGNISIGDIVNIDDFRGVIEDIGLRTTKIADFVGNVKIISNSSLNKIINLSSKLSLAIVLMSISNNEDLKHVEDILSIELPKMKEQYYAFLSAPVYLGVFDVTPDAIVLGFYAQVEEKEIKGAERNLRRLLYLTFVNNNIKIAHHKMDVNYYLTENDKNELLNSMKEKRGK